MTDTPTNPLMSTASVLAVVAHFDDEPFGVVRTRGNVTVLFVTLGCV